MSSPIPANPVARGLLILILAAGVYFFKGFLLPVLAALIIGFASWPLYLRLVRACGGRTPVAASVALTVILLVLVVPFTILISYGVNEVTTWVAWLVEANRQGVPVPRSVEATPFLGQWLAENWQRYSASLAP